MTHHERFERQIRLAKAMGFHVYHYDKDHPDNCYYLLLDADGNPALWQYPNNERKTEEEAWQDAPDFENDPGAREGLLEWWLGLTPCYSIEFQKRPSHCVAIVSDSVKDLTSTADTCAEALLSAIDAALQAKEKA